jgi:hypothetical protein
MLALLFSVRSAEACSYDGPATLTLDTSSADETAPAPPDIIGVDVQRGRSGDGKACENLGSITISVARPADDPDAHDAVGYRLEIRDGDLPDGLELDSAPLLGPEIVLIWTDGGPPHGAFEATLALVPVDVAGNEGEPADVTVGDAGGCGCRTGAGGAPVLASGFVSLLTALRGRRRERKSLVA